MKLINKKGNMTFGEESLKIVLTVIGIFILIMLAVKLYNSTKSTEFEMSSATLDKIINTASLLEEGVIREEIIESPKGWNLMSVEQPKWGLCSGFFCLCICKETNCEGQDVVCKPTGERFILLRDYHGDSYREVRVIYKEIPFGAELEYKKGTFYPFNEEAGFIGNFPIFLRFNSVGNGRWEWGFDLENWVGVDESRMKGGFWDGYPLPKESKKFIEEFKNEIFRINYEAGLNLEQKKETLKNKGIEFLNNEGIRESKGVVILKVKK